MSEFVLTKELLERMSDQERDVAVFLDQEGSITPVQAIQELGVMRLAARIFDLVSKYGLPIDREIVSSTNRYGEKIRFSKYSKAVQDNG
jgi:hypothetical protein